LTKLDGSARGGFVFAVQEQSGIPVKLVGQGEGIDDLTGFTPHVFVRQLLD
jgi:fused signal recognition particle receptor